MSRSKELWWGECDRICSDYQNGKMTFDQAAEELRRKGWEQDAIEVELAEWDAG